MGRVGGFISISIYVYLQLSILDKVWIGVILLGKLGSVDMKEKVWVAYCIDMVWGLRKVSNIGYMVGFFG